MNVRGGEKVVVIGSGPAAAGAVLALLEQGQHDITVLDVGGRLEGERAEVVDTMRQQSPAEWSERDLRLIQQQPVTVPGVVPQKRAYGSDFPFRNLGQVDGLTFVAGANDAPISSAFGGFSNVWGAQIMPFSRATFDTWPVSYDELTPHYRKILNEVPLGADTDDLAPTFPLLTDRPRPLPPLAPICHHVLSRYEAHRRQVRDRGVTLGRARLAFSAERCVRCGLCMTGCPYGLIYSASQTFERLIREDRIRYHARALVTRVAESEGQCEVRLRDLTTGHHSSLDADRVFLACGGMGSTRLALGSLPGAPNELQLSESVQFAVPFVSRRHFGDPRNHETFTLNQFNILVSFDDDDHTTSHIHCYPYNPAVLGALPAPLRARLLERPLGQLLGRLTIGLGYLPSWASPPMRVRVTRRSSDALPDLVLGEEGRSAPLLMRQVMRRLWSVSRRLDLYPVESSLQVSAAGKSYHFGGSFPHRADPGPGLSTDRLGRPRPWTRIHLVDGAVLPSVPSTTFTLSVMANAHRIATEAGR